MGSYSPKNPMVVPIPTDKRYRSWKTEAEPVANAVIIYMMDVSGSMGDEQKEIVRIESFWIDTWIQTNYNGVVTRYIIHDAVAQEVDAETFFHTRESGGTEVNPRDNPYTTRDSMTVPASLVGSYQATARRETK